MATNEFTPTTDSNHFAFGFLGDELETLLALAIALERQLEPTDPDHPEDEHPTTAWRLSQVLNERLSSMTFTNNMRQLLLGHVES